MSVIASLAALISLDVAPIGQEHHGVSSRVLLSSPIRPSDLEKRQTTGGATGPNSAARASDSQVRYVPNLPLDSITVPIHYNAPESVRTRKVFECEGRRYEIELDEVRVDGPALRQVTLNSLVTEAGPIEVPTAVKQTLDSYLLVFHADLSCSGDVFSLTFTGRRLGEDNSSFVAWFEDDRFTELRLDTFPHSPHTAP